VIHKPATLVFIFRPARGPRAPSRRGSAANRSSHPGSWLFREAGSQTAPCAHACRPCRRQRPTDNRLQSARRLFPRSVPAIGQPFLRFYGQDFAVRHAVPMRHGLGTEVKAMSHARLEVVLHQPLLDERAFSEGRARFSPADAASPVPRRGNECRRAWLSVGWVVRSGVGSVVGSCFPSFSTEIRDHQTGRTRRPRRGTSSRPGRHSLRPVAGVPAWPASGRSGAWTRAGCNTAAQSVKACTVCSPSRARCSRWPGEWVGERPEQTIRSGLHAETIALWLLIGRYRSVKSEGREAEQQCPAFGRRRAQVDSRILSAIR